MAAEVTVAQRVNLVVISRTLQNVTNNKLLEGDSPAIKKINNFITSWSEKYV